ncbi:hypothetical protein GTY54_43035 [Streptomyces sp. SID625]|nr:hypothetical protein [Streptomyces sp. SID625]
MIVSSPPPVDVEAVLLCDVKDDGTVAGTVLVEPIYDARSGERVGTRVVDPTTGAPYTPQGTLQPCPDSTCLPPVQFCQTSTSTTPVEHPGRQYDITLPVNPGFGVDSLQIDAVTHAAGITWSIFDVDGSQFAADIQSFIQARMPSGATVTVNNPNAGLDEICGGVQPFHVHIECLRLDQKPPNLVELVYNGGQDLVANPAYNEVPPYNIHQPCGFHLPKRQDAGGTLACTSVANRGWETNDYASTFEIWCDDVRTDQATTPTPRGTPVQEISSYGSGDAQRATIWQTFEVPAAGTFNIRVVHGARDPGEEHRITLSTGDTDDNPVGDVITDISTPASVTNSGGPNPWTTFAQTQDLAPGIYTLALSTTNPVFPQRGGLFTDMRVFLDRPGLRATAVTDDGTCVVTTQETGDHTVCSFWQPQCSGGRISTWQRVDTGLTLTNAQFWAQVPTPSCCTSEAAASDGGGSSAVQSNMLTSDLVCVTIAGISSNAIRLVVTDPSGGTLQQTFLGAGGTPVTPDSWTPGACTVDRFMADQVLCDFGATDTATGGPVQFLRKYVQTVDVNGNPRVDARRDFRLDGSAVYLPVGPVGTCKDAGRDEEVLVLCDSTPTRFLRRYNYDSSTGALLGIVDTTLDGATPFTPVGAVGVCTTPVATDFDFTEEVLCDSQGTAFIRRFTFNSATGAVTATTNLTLAGAAFTPVGAVGVCSDCCPQVIGNGCTNTGSGSYTAIRSTGGTISLIDSVTGAAVTAGNIIPCPSDNTVRTLTAQARLIADADTPWSPGADVVGTLTSVTMTVLSGTATLTDQNGTVAAGLPAGYTATWSVEDDNTLNGPTSIDAVGGTTVVHWTQR